MKSSMEVKDITVIVPVYEEFDDIKELLSKSIESAKAMGDVKIMLVGPDKSFGTFKEKGSGVTCLENKGETDFSSQVNLAVSKCKTDYFSILEYDDEYLPIWANNVVKYSKSMDDVFAFLPLNEIILFPKKDEGSVAYINEPVWASSFSEELGYLDLDSLMNYPEFNMTGAVMKKDVFLDLGGLKPSIKVSFWYEFMLRAVYNEKKIFVIPKVGYYHFLERPGSLSVGYKDNMKVEEADWWMTLAQQEYFFKKDRNKTYDEE